MKKTYPCPNPRCANNNAPMVRNGKTARGKDRWVCKTVDSKCYETTDPTAPYRGDGKKVEAKLEFGATLEWTDTIIVTWAQNATPVHRGFLTGLKRLRDDLFATLMVTPGRYKNPTSRWEESQQNAQWWAPELVPFLINKRTRLNDNLMLLADVHVQPTAQYPLSDLEGLSHGESSILGHPKRELIVVPTPNHSIAKVMWTTGSCTIENYTDTKAGKKGEFHHIIGALVVKLVNGKIFHIDEITARKDGAFCFFEKAYLPDGTVKPAGDYPGLSVGDLHPPFSDPAVIRATFGDGGLVDRLKPKKIILHDTFDCYAGTPHHKDRPFIAIAKRKSGMDDMEKEVRETIDFVIEKVKGRETFITSSNHDDMFRRWVENTDWKKDPTNALFYLRTATYMAERSVMTKHGAFTPDPFHYWVKKRRQKNLHCLTPLDSLMIAGFQMALHGDKGANGARGSIRNLAKIGSKVVSGHGHAPGIEGGHRRNGTCTFLNLEYTGPIGSWMNAHTSIDPMGKSHSHICVDGAFWAGQV